MRRFFNSFLIFLFLSSIFSLSYAMKRIQQYSSKKGIVAFVIKNKQDEEDCAAFQREHPNIQTIKVFEQSEDLLEESLSNQEDQKKDIEKEEISCSQEKTNEDVVFDQAGHALDQETLTDLEIWSSINLEKLMAIREIEENEERYRECEKEISEQLTYYFEIYGNGIQDAIKKLQTYITKAGNENQ